MNLTIIPYAGWQKCLRLANNEIELIVTSDVGPRIIRCGFIGGENEFIEYPEQVGKTGEGVYRSYGGHRLWSAPEEHSRTYYPDNVPVEWRVKGEGLHLLAPVETTTGLRKEMEIVMDPVINTVHVIHRITNCGTEPVAIASWSISVMAPGGRAIIPHEPYAPHPESLLPVRSMALWSYTDMHDPRWTWGSRYIQLRQDQSAVTPQKIGVLATHGWLAYTNGDRLFVKTIMYTPDAAYPDFNCNAEVFTNARMLELETLSPLKTIAPGELVAHDEHWLLVRGVTLGTTDEEIDEWQRKFGAAK